MVRRVKKIQVNGKEFNACPLCGGKTSDYAWRNFKKCAECNKLIDQGNTQEQVRVIRLQEKSSEIQKVQSENESYKRLDDRPDFDFINTYPPGILIRSNGDEEAMVLKDVYTQYSEIYGHLNEFNSLINGILSASLEAFRVNQELGSDAKKKSKRMSIIDRKNYIDMLAKMSSQINSSITKLDDIKKDRSSNASNIIIEEFKKMLKFHHDRDQEYMGVGVCPSCDQRIIFKTKFSTFKARYEELIHKYIKEMKNNGLYDDKTLNAFENKILNRLTDDAFLDTYMVHHIRQIEKTLI